MRPARALVLAALALLAAPAARADDQRAVDALNLPAKVVKDSSKSWKPVFDAYLAMTPAPAVKGGLSAATVWPGMPEWEPVKSWAAANAKMGEALRAAQGMVAFAMPYGRGSVPPAYVERGVFVGIGDGTAVYFADASYLKPLGEIQAYVTAEMYRLGQEKKFDEAFGLGLACMRVLRQVADQHLLSEKTAAMRGLCEMASVQRDVLQTFLEDVPAAVIKKYARGGYTLVRAADGERLRRLDMPEGDRVLAEALISQVFDAQGQADGERFVEAMAQFQSRREPLSAFGANRRWEQIAGVHASLDATRDRLTRIYDDWWRRWRARYSDPILEKPTIISKTNAMKYAMVLAMATDLNRLFALRQWLNAELNGTAVAFGVAAYYREAGSWPSGISNTYASTEKRFDFDPWDPKRGRWQYEKADAPRAIEFEGAQVQVSGGIIYARGADKEDGGAKKATVDGLAGDFVAWPALRAVSRGATTK
jgi:hypothetical protein